MPTRRVFAALLSVVCAGVAGAVTSRPNNGQAPGQIEEVAQPPHWVPFEADLQEYKDNGAVEYKGRFHRASDGSTRETRDAPGDELRGFSSILICNILQNAAYVFLSTRRGIRWTRQQMRLPAGGWHPMEYPAGILNRLPDPVAGFEVYEYRGATGERVLKAPALNFFDPVRVTPSGRRTVYFSVRQGEPPADLFEPPPGVPVADVPGYNCIESGS